MAVLGIAGTVAVFVAMMALAQGFRATLVASGSESNAILLRAGAGNEMSSGLGLDQAKVVEDLAGVARGANGPLASPEFYTIVDLPMRSTGISARSASAP